MLPIGTTRFEAGASAMKKKAMKKNSGGKRRRKRIASKTSPAQAAKASNALASSQSQGCQPNNGTALYE